VQQRLADTLKRLVPKVDEVVSESFEQVTFFDAGSNFERVNCPGCAEELDLGWWQDRMDEDWKDGAFVLAKYALPCCGVQATLNDLAYYGPQAFGRYNCSAMNPGIGELSVAQRAELERVIGVPLVVVRRHL